MKAEGKSVFNFAAGEPDFDTPQAIKDAAVAALQGGATKYSPAPGLPELRACIAEKLRAENGLAYEPEQIVVSNGAKQSVFNALMALCKPGDEVVIPAPFWLSYPEMVKVTGATPVFAPGAEADGFKLQPSALEAALTDRSRALIINSPSNPSGLVYTRDELRALVDVAVAHGLTVISDEIYEKMVYEGAEHVSVAGFSDEAYGHTVTVNGFSKAFAMTGWRLGYLAAPPELARAISSLQSHITSGPNTFAQHGAVQALKSAANTVPDMVAAFAERRELLYERLSGIDGVTCVKPMGAFYMLPNISRFGLDSVTFATRLLDEQGVAVVPGAPFGAPDNIRISYACSLENIVQGMDRFERFVQSLR